MGRFLESFFIKHSLDPLHGSYLRLKWLQSSFVATSSMESLLVMFLVVASTVQCDFVPFIQRYIITGQIVTSIAFQLFSGFFTDRTEKSSHVVLFIVSVLSALTDTVLFFGAVYQPAVIVIIFCLRYCLIIQTGNSSGKMLKLRLQKEYMSGDAQVKTFNNFIVMGELVGRILTVLAFGSIILLIKFGGVGFDFSKWLMYGILLFWDLTCLAATFSFKSDYYLPTHYELNPSSSSTSTQSEDNSQHSGNNNNNNTNNNDNITIIKDTENMPFLADSSTDSDDTIDSLGDESPDIKNHRKKGNTPKVTSKSILRFAEEPPGPTEPFKQFIITSVKTMWASQLLFKITIHLVGSILVYSFVKIVLQYEISNQGVDENIVRTRENFCGGTFSNYIQITTVTEFVRIGTAIFWFAILTRVRPYHFYNRLYYVASALLVLLVASIYFPIGAHLGSIVLAIITSIVYLIGNYDNVIVSAVSPPEILGFAYSTQGSLIYLTALIPVLLTLLSPATWVWATILLSYLLGLISWNFFITKRHKDELCDLDDTSMSTGDRWCIARWVFGYS